MLNDILKLTELYLHATESILEDKSWSDFHDEVIKNASKEGVKLFADAYPKEGCKYALFIDVNTKNKSWEVKYKDHDNYIAIEKIIDGWTEHLFWQASGGARSDNNRNTPHKIYDYNNRNNFSADNFIEPLETILNDYCLVIEGKGKEKVSKESGPLFWDVSRKKEREWLSTLISILKDKKVEINKEIKGKFPSIKSGESVFVGLTIDGKPIVEYEVFRRYLSFVRMRAGIKAGTKEFKNKIASDVIRNFIGKCNSCQNVKPLLSQWTVVAELSFYQMTDKSRSSHDYADTASFRMCQSCTDLLFIFKQHLLNRLTKSRKNNGRGIGGNECLVLPSIKSIPKDQQERRRLYESLNRLWASSTKGVTSSEERLLYRLGQLPSYATVTFIFGDNIVTKGDSTNVRRLDKVDIVFPDVLPSRLSEIANTIKETKKQLHEMWNLTGSNWQCEWNIQENFYLLQEIFYPSWNEDKQNKNKMRKRYKSLRRTEVEKYLRTIFYGNKISYEEIVEDSYSNLLSAIKATRNAKKEDKSARGTRDRYIGNMLSLLVLLERLNVIKKPIMEENDMTKELQVEFKAMPELGKFIEAHPLLKDTQYLAPFFVGCLFSYAEFLQRDSSRLAVYNWLGTMAFTYDDILQDIYPKTLNYIKNKEKIIYSPRLQEFMKAIAYYHVGQCDNDRVALTAFCHGWAVGRNFILRKDIVKKIKDKFKDLKMSMTDELKKYMAENKEKINKKDSSVCEELLRLVPEDKKEEISNIWQPSDNKTIINNKGGGDDE